MNGYRHYNKNKETECRLTSPSMCTSLIRPFVSITAVAIFLFWVITFLGIIYMKRDSLFALQLWWSAFALFALRPRWNKLLLSKMIAFFLSHCMSFLFLQFFVAPFFFVRCWKGKTHNLISTVLNGIVAFLNLKTKVYTVLYCITVIVNMLQDCSYYVTYVTVTYIMQ